MNVFGVIITYYIINFLFLQSVYTQSALKIP